MPGNYVSEYGLSILRIFCLVKDHEQFKYIILRTKNLVLINVSEEAEII